MSVSGPSRFLPRDVGFFPRDVGLSRDVGFLPRDVGLRRPASVLPRDLGLGRPARTQVGFSRLALCLIWLGRLDSVAPSAWLGHPAVWIDLPSCLRPSHSSCVEELEDEGGEEGEGQADRGLRITLVHQSTDTHLLAVILCQTDRVCIQQFVHLLSLASLVPRNVWANSAH